MTSTIPFTDLLVEFLIARDELFLEESKTPSSFRQISGAKERLSEATKHLNGFFEKEEKE